MKKETLKSLIDQQGLPLDVRIKDWPEKCYFNAQEISSGKVFGCIIQGEKKFSNVGLLLTTPARLYRPLVTISKAKASISPETNKNGLFIAKEHYIKGETTLFIINNDTISQVVFDRFESKNGHDVIYVTYNNNSTKFYSFPNTPYLFANKDDAQNAIVKKNMKIPTSSLAELTIAAFKSLDSAVIPNPSKDIEMEREKDRHSIVDQHLISKLQEPSKTFADANTCIIQENYYYQTEKRIANEDGCPLGYNFEQSHYQKLASYEKKASAAQIRINEIEGMRSEPYFGRIDLGKSPEDTHTAYIGKETIPGYVVDWRDSKVGNAYYHSELLLNRDDIFLGLKRDISISHGIFKNYKDYINQYDNVFNADLIATNKADYSAVSDSLLTKLLEESRMDKSTHDIIKTIQGDQYEIITTDFRNNVVVNGCAGSGKTMIMYHRLSYMAYNYENALKKTFNPENVYIFSPSPVFDATNNELMKQLSIDKVNQAPFSIHIDNLINKYCEEYGIIPFFGITSLIHSAASGGINFFSEEAFEEFRNKHKDLCSNVYKQVEYKKWVAILANQLLEAAGFKIISKKEFPTSPSELKELLNTNEYYLNDSLLKKNSNGNKDYFSPNILTNTSYSAVRQILNSSNTTTITEKRRNRIKRNYGLLIASLSENMYVSKSKSSASSSFFELLDNAMAFEKMITLVTVQKLLDCVINAGVTNNKDFILKALYLYQKYISQNHSKHFSLYILLLLSKEMGEIITDDSIIFLDEFQNYSSFEIECLKNAFMSPIFNLYGDFDQRIEKKGHDLKEKLFSLLSPEMYNINVNYRNAKQITEYINKAVHKKMKSIGVNGVVKEIALEDCHFEIRNRTAIICKDVKLANICLNRYIAPILINNVSNTGKLSNESFSILTVSESKGLEFDTVYVLSYDMSENEKYVAYTRALDSLIVIPDDLQLIRKKEKKAKVEKAAIKAQEKKERKLAYSNLISVLNDAIIKKENAMSNTGNTLSKKTFSSINDPYINKDQSLEEELKSLTEYHEYLKQQKAAIAEAEQKNNERLYAIASQTILHSITQLEKAITVLEAIRGYNDSQEISLALQRAIEMMRSKLD